MAPSMNENFDSLTPDQIVSVIYGIKSKNKHQREYAINNFSNISKKLGSDRTIHELVPYYIESTTVNIEEIAGIIDQIAKLDFKQLKSDEIEFLLNTIKQYTEIDSTDTRNSFAQLMSILVDVLDNDQFEAIFLPYFHNLLEEDYAPMKFTFFTILKSIAEILTEDMLEEIFIKYQELGEIPVEVQVHMIDASSEIFKYANENTKDTILQLISEYIESKDPRVALALLTILPNIDASKDQANSYIKQIILFEDFRVQTKAIETLTKLRKISPDDIVDYLNYYYQTKNKILLVSIADALPSCKGCSDKSINTLRDMVDDFLQYDFPPIIVSTLKALYPLIDELGNEYVLDSITQFIASSTVDLQLAAVSTIIYSDFSEDEKGSIIDGVLQKIDWRGRFAIAESDSLLRDNNTLLERLIFDDSYRVRNRAAKTFGNLSKTEGETYINKVIIPTIYKLSVDEDYQHRQTAIQLCLELEHKSVAKDILENLSTDPVSNVRITVMKISQLMGFEDIVIKLKEDPDEDVRDAV